MSLWFLCLSILSSCLSFLSFAHAESLYSADHYAPLAADHRALNVGDNVTVIIIETSTASASTESNVNKALNASANLDLTAAGESGQLDARLGRGSGGETGRSGELRAQISATVKRRDELGRLYISGEQSIIINGEEQTIGVTGWLRPIDIMPDNWIYSTRLANARIEYRGDGVISRSRKPGIIYWILDLIGLI